MQGQGRQGGMCHWRRQSTGWLTAKKERKEAPKSHRTHRQKRSTQAGQALSPSLAAGGAGNQHHGFPERYYSRAPERSARSRETTLMLFLLRALAVLPVTACTVQQKDGSSKQQPGTQWRHSDQLASVLSLLFLVRLCIIINYDSVITTFLSYYYPTLQLLLLWLALLAYFLIDMLSLSLSLPFPLFLLLSPN